ncbi:hypothetical protein [Pseudonocardia sp. NPDC049635]|uniref:hypothetical protein n=1 Tax=Pseudonocardia sp. NPDC049635 TaxID=3155506 RepID=UPI0034088228
MIGELLEAVSGEFFCSAEVLGDPIALGAKLRERGEDVLRVVLVEAGGAGVGECLELCERFL